ncbi:MAG: heptaprenyl diphosphate synthase [Spirochaetales bacterium]|jgi:heptaprenyl diphosphate synthase|nr:heptaprenyl diphosphate synthase [Spirochaetales bacterium]
MKKPRLTLSVTRRDLIALLGACCMLLSLVEHMIPKPLPFLRLGLANLPLLISLGLLSAPQVMLLASLKVVGQGLVTGTLFSYIFLLSAAGTFSSVLVMLVVRRIGGRYISLIGISVMGALSSTTAQLGLASVFLFGAGTRYIVAPFLVVGLVTSVILGIAASAFCTDSRWYQVSLMRINKDD